MNYVRLILLMISLAALGACSGSRTCEKEQSYQRARLGQPIVVPDDLDELESVKELKIPEPSGQPPRPDDAGCIDKPPGVS